ncbi:hypothetical protein CRE_24817 [Caenorhabditis remanei]|uniref:Uncharacterized protein n=1 Tax=Caenorhabditis remanei TaxID=31234 RepID=E3NHN6_CAERE|nr:hypothetical protein CRE_24817 [Caenorhabditis remanei]
MGVGECEDCDSSTLSKIFYSESLNRLSDISIFSGRREVRMSTAQQTNSKSDGPVHDRAVCIPMGPTLTLDSVIFAIECEIFETRAYMTEYSKCKLRDAAGTPADSSAAGTPANSSAAGTPADSSAAGTPDDSSAAGTPDDSSAVGTPDNSSAAGTPANSSAAGTPADSSAAGTPDDSSAAGTPADSSMTTIRSHFMMHRPKAKEDNKKSTISSNVEMLHIYMYACGGRPKTPRN